MASLLIKFSFDFLVYHPKSTKYYLDADIRISYNCNTNIGQCRSFYTQLNTIRAYELALAIEHHIQQLYLNLTAHCIVL